MASGSNEKMQKPENGTLPRGLLGRQGKPLAPGGRLPSFRPSRDLTLGVNRYPNILNKHGVSVNNKQRKTFTPNIPAPKEKIIKTEPVKVEEPKKTSVKVKTEHAEKRSRIRHGYVQTAGIFSDGIVSQRHLTPQNRHTGGTRERVKVKREVMDNTTFETKANIECMDFDIYTDEEDFGVPDAPVPIGVSKPGKATLTTKKLELKPASDIKIKQEINEDSSMVSDSDASVTPADVLKEDGSLIFCQFPEYLPYIKDTSEPSTSSSNVMNFDNVPSNLCALKDMREGYIGKLRVMKSGKVKFIIGQHGEHQFEVNTPIHKHVREDVVVQKLNNDKNSIDLTWLGTVKHRLTMSPDWDLLLKSSDDDDD